MKTALYTVVAGVVVASVAFQPSGPTRLTRLMGNRIMRFLGKTSYGMFLWQFLIIFAFFNFIHLKDTFHGGTYSTIEVIGILIAVGLLTIGVSAVGYVCIERPAQRLYRLVGAPSRGTAAAAAQRAAAERAATQRAASPGAAMARQDGGGPPGLA